MYNKEVEKIATYIQASHSLFYIQHSDFFAVREIIKELKKKEVEKIEIFKNYKFYEYTNALGSSIEYGEPFDSDESEIEDGYSKELDDWLKDKVFDASPKFLVLKDIVTTNLSSQSISYIKEIAEKTVTSNDFDTIIIISESKPIPFPEELKSLVTIVDIEPLCEDDIKSTIRKFVNENGIKCDFIDNTDRLNEFVYSFKGLQQNQIEQILCTAVSKENELRLKFDQQTLVLEEKEQLIKKSGILEIVSSTSDFGKIGGLEYLKNWLRDKEVIFKDIVEAQNFGVSIPKGILIAGMPGCGKSLAAKATAKLFNVPLVRLDIGSMLGKYVGESEANMRKALSLSESFSPCVLWIDEIEKAFAGMNADEAVQSEVVVRLFGQFLTWMQEKSSAVFIVATANNINSLPPELLRKGRFDELFFVSLPTERERKDIFKIKFESKNESKKGNWDLSQIDFDKLAKETNGCSGSDIEGIVNTAIEKKYIDRKRNDNVVSPLTTEYILDIKKSKKSISEMLGDKIKKLEEKYKELHLINASN